MERVFPEPNTGCWIWSGRLNHDGYGSLHIEDNEFGVHTAHRYSYILHKGELNGLQVLHSCDVRCCVNPDHLFLGTQTENILDMDNKRRRRVGLGVRNARSKINDSIAVEIKSLYSTGLYRQIDIAKKFNINRSLVGAIVANRTWKHVKGIEGIKRHTHRYGGTLFSPIQAQVIREAVKAGFKQDDIASYFKTWQQTISCIGRNKYYKSV